MGSRAVSADGEDTVLYAREFLAGLRLAGLISCGKHFPGLGEADLDTHFHLPRVRKSFKKMWEEDILPYRKLRSRLPMVLISHATYPSFTSDDVPASLSHKWITEVLRKRIGYRGLILSDDLEMGGVLKAAPIEQAAIDFVRAGGDIGLVCHKEERIQRCYEAMIETAANDKKFAGRVEDSIARVLAFKRKARDLLRTKPAPNQRKMHQLSRQLWEFSEEVRLKTIQRENLQAQA
jgi:beta-N-acetylhexosaminidase